MKQNYSCVCFTYSVFVTVFLLATTGSAIAGSCGPDAHKWKRVAVPDYICFDKSGGHILYPTCAVIANPDVRAVVYFGTACSAHDQCYANPGQSKSSCDNQFKNILVETCRGSINQGWSKAVRTCMDDANTYFEAVKRAPDACEAYKQAQRKRGVKSPRC